jgi:hypothetical protein
MKTGNPIDGMYFFLLILPVVLSFWIGDLLRKKILSHLILESYWRQDLSTLVGILVEIIIIISGVSVGFLLIKLV